MLEFENGGVASLDWTVPLSPLPENTPTLVVLHGLTGGSHENYIRGLLQIVTYQGVCNTSECALIGHIYRSVDPPLIIER